MSSTRLHLDGPLGAGLERGLAEDRAHQLRHVLRLRDGDEVLVFNALHGEWRAAVRFEGKRGVTVRLEAAVRPPMAEPGPRLVLAPIRRNRLDWLVEKAVELGCAAFAPVLTERTVVRLERVDRLQAIAVEAAEQCGRLSVPPIEPVSRLSEWLASRQTVRPLVLLDESHGGVPLLALPQAAEDCDILVGPEGGFTPGEIAMTLRSEAVLRADLGPQILRSETAALAALAVCSAARALSSRGEHH